MSGPSTTNTSGDDTCLAYFPTGFGGYDICRRPDDHPSVDVDGVGHSTMAIPTAMHRETIRVQVRELLHEAWLAGKSSKPEDESPYK